MDVQKSAVMWGDRLLKRFWDWVITPKEVVVAPKKDLEPYDPDRDQWLLDNTSQAAHEPRAALRLLRRGRKGQALVDATGIKPTALQKALREAMDEEGAAFNRGCPIHDQPQRGV